MFRTAFSAVLLAILGLTVAMAPRAIAAVLHVPGDYATIAEACAAMATGDVVEIAPGLYEDVNVSIADVSGTIRGTGDGAGDVVLRGAGPLTTMFDLWDGWSDPSIWTFENLTFQGSATIPTDGTGGGVIFQTSTPGSGLELENCVFENFHTNVSFHVLGNFEGLMHVRARNCVFRNLVTHPESDAGAISIQWGVSAIFRDCLFQDNQGGKGGALSVISFSTEFDTMVFCTIEGCVFSGNTATEAGAALFVETGLGYVQVRECTFVGNHATSTGVIGTAPLGDTTAIQIHRCVIAQNEGRAFGAYGGDPIDVDLLHVTQTDIHGNTGGDWVATWGELFTAPEQAGRGNICADPLFCDPAGGDYHLQPGSPCLDWGLGAFGQGCDGGLSAAPDGGPQPGTRDRQALNHPNPFNPNTTIVFDLVQPGSVRVEVHDVRGALVRTLLDQQRPAGRHEVNWDGRDDAGRELPSGVYLSRLESNGQVSHGRMTLVR